ncbi:MAG: hypothetical protein MUC50_06410 [Myxococcota bacterium]|jgi:hypothetical protein|nr:hypothetical protein [Myxococcota bacterium]
MKTSRFLTALFFLSLCSSAAPAAAQMDPGADDEEFLSGKKAASSEKGGESFHEGGNDDNAFLANKEKEEIAAPEKDKNADLAEDPKKAYLGLGARFRWIIIPRWLIESFGAEVKSKPNKHMLVSNVGGGPEFTFRKKGLDITAALWFAGLGWKDGVSFKEEGATGNSWEYVENDLKTILITADFIWSTSITDWFAITYGAGLGIGIPIGDITRTEASSASGGYGACPGPGNDPPGQWCQAPSDDEQYNQIYDLPTGIVPWINILVGMRFKIHRHAAIYADGGFGLGFLAGLRGVYIF